MEYTKCLVELDEILNYLSREDLEKIPIKIRNSIKEQKDKNYVWEYDETKELKEQKLERKTIAMLAYLNMEYLLNAEQKALMAEMHRVNEQQFEKEKMEKYNPDDLFKNNKTNTVHEENATSESVAMVEYKESFFKKVINKIKNFFGRK